MPHLHPAPQHQLQQVQVTGTTFHACPTRLSARLPHACRTPSCTACAHMRSRSWLTWAEEAQPQCVCASHHRAPPLVARRGGLRGAGLGRLGRVVCASSHSVLPLFSPEVRLTDSVLPRTLTGPSNLPPTSRPPPLLVGHAGWASLFCHLMHAPGCGLCRDYERVASSDRGLPLSPSLSLSLPLACRLLLPKGLQHARLRLLGCAPALLCAWLCSPLVHGFARHSFARLLPFLTPCRVRLTKSTGVFAYSPTGSGVGKYVSGVFADCGATCVHSNVVQHAYTWTHGPLYPTCLHMVIWSSLS